MMEHVVEASGVSFGGRLYRWPDGVILQRVLCIGSRCIDM